MADETTRIINLTEATETDSGMYFVTDSLAGTKKLSIETLIDSSLTEEMAAAPASSVGENASDISTLQTQMETKANVDGAYEAMTVGNAEQLVSTVFTEDSVPYLFRTSGGSIDIGDREYDEIVGGTVVWNQLVLSPLPQSSGNWSVSSSTAVDTSVTNDVMKITVTSNTSGQDVIMVKTSAFIKGHKYLVLSRKSANNMYVRFTLLDGWTGCGEADAMFGFRDTVISATESSTGTTTRLGMTVQPWNTNIQPVGTEIYLYSVNLIDLTTFFGSSTIPDYIYSLEQSTAGSGVAWLKKYLPKLFQYNEYTTPTIESVENVSAHEFVGFNQWDEEWEVGTYNTTTGAKASSDASLRSKNFIPVIAGQSYYITDPLTASSTNTKYICFYDSEQEFISSISITTANGRNFTVPENAWYMTFAIRYYIQQYTTYNNDICINLSWDGERNGEYEPYVKHSYPLDSTLTLRGIPKLDANNSLYYDGDTYEADGTVTRRYGIVDLGSLSYGYDSDGSYFYSTGLQSLVKRPTSYNDKANIIMPIYVNTSRTELVNNPSTNMICAVNSSGLLQVRNLSYTDTTAFKTAMSGIYLIYELATPTTETADPYTNPQIVDDWGTEEYVTEGIVPVGHNTKYAPNLRAKLEMLPDSPNGDGDYIVRQNNGQNAFVPLVIPSELPNSPTTDGTYVLKCTVSGGQATLSWEVEE